MLKPQVHTLTVYLKTASESNQLACFNIPGYNLACLFWTVKESQSTKLRNLAFSFLLLLIRLVVDQTDRLASQSSDLKLPLQTLIATLTIFIALQKVSFFI